MLVCEKGYSLVQNVRLIDLSNKGNFSQHVVLISDPPRKPYNVSFYSRLCLFFCFFLVPFKPWRCNIPWRAATKWPREEEERNVACALRMQTGLGKGSDVFERWMQKRKRETRQDLFRCHDGSLNENKHIRSLQLGRFRQSSLGTMKRETPEVFTEIIQTVLQSIICPLQAIHHLATED